MNFLILTFLAVASVLLATTNTQPIDVNNAAIEHRSSNDPIIFEENTFPYYGGLRGQYLQQVRGPKDTHAQTGMYIVAQSPQVAFNRQGTAAAVASNVVAISNNRGGDTAAFAHDFNKIQLAAARLVAIQEMAKRKGSFSEEDNKIYADSLLELGQAAQNLAMLQQTGKIKDFSLLLQPEGLMPSAQKQPAQQYPINVQNEAEHSIGEQKVEAEEVTEQHFNEDDLLPPNAEDPYEDVSDSIAITAPKKDASVAEAKPVGLSIAGEGGVASSKPNAVALSGRNGLAVSSPKATAIAGVTPEEAAAFSVHVPTRNQLVIKASQHAFYDDYDYSDVGPVRSAHTRDTPLTRDADSTPTAHHIRNRLRTSQTTGGNHATAKRKVASAPSLNAGNDFVNKWKTAIAEDYAATARNANAAKFVQPRNKPLNKFLLRSDDGQSFYLF